MDFEYCECGCKGYNVTVEGEDFWVFWDLKKSYLLYRGHGHTSVKVKEFGSLDEAVKAAEKIAKGDESS